MKASPLPNDQRPGCGHSLLNFLSAQKEEEDLFLALWYSEIIPLVLN